MFGIRPKHPKSLILLSICYALFMAAFGSILASLTLYQTNQLHMVTDKAYGVFAAAVALLWVLPLLGGYLAGKCGYAQAATVGLFVCLLGILAFCLNSVAGLYAGLALFVVGNALATPAIWCLVDYGYAKDSPLREAGFTLFYLFFNFGVILGIFVGGYLAEHHGFATEFEMDAACVALSFVWFLVSKHKLSHSWGRSIDPVVRWSSPVLYLVISGCVIVATPISLLLFDHLNFNNILMMAVMVGMIGLLLFKALRLRDRQARRRLIAFVCLAVISVIFWILYNLEPSFLSVFIQNNVTSTLWGMDIPAASYVGFDAVFVILIGLILSQVWRYLSLKKMDLPLALKFAASLMIIGLGFMYLAWKIHLNHNGKVPAYDIVLAYAIFATAELLVSPLGIAMVGKLAPKGDEGLMMGFWQLCSGVGGVLAGFIAILPHLPSTPVPLADSNPIYLDTFLYVGAGAAAAGLIVVLFVPILARLMK